MNKPASPSMWKYYAFAAAWILPWLAYGVLSTDVLPESWQFERWPEGIRRVFVSLFCIFMIAEVLFPLWYFLIHSDDEPTS